MGSSKVREEIEIKRRPKQTSQDAAEVGHRTETERATEHNARELYEFLTEDERRHLNLLATTLEYLDHLDSWYLTKEQWIVEG